jgi:hypothetical protein
LNAATATSHCLTCICGKRAPVQGCYAGGYGAGTISWEEYLLAYASYANLYGRSQSAERLAERGGLGWFELVTLLGRDPTTWKPAR